MATGFGYRRFGLSFDLQLYPAHGWRDRGTRTDAYPDVLIILDHARTPVDRDEEGLRLWRRGMSNELTTTANVVKVSDSNSGSEVDSKASGPLSWQTIEAFGVARSMSRATFLWTNSSATLTRSTQPFMKSPPLHAEIRQMLFHDNAARYYRLFDVLEPTVESKSELCASVFMKYATD